MVDVSRRQALALGAGALALGSQGFASPDAPPSLHSLAKAKGLRFGTAMAAYQLNDPNYLDLVKRECGTLVAENEHKIYVIEPERGEINFAPADALVGFAKANGLMMRGHTLLWNRRKYSPAWLNEMEFASAADAEKLLGDYIPMVAGRYSPFIYSWDVVNETIDPETGEMRNTAFSSVMGEELIDFAFYQAKEAAPNATLAYNDYMSWETGNEKHRAGVLKLLEGLVSRGVPIDALGIQSHSNYDMPNEFTPEKQRAWRGFCDDVVGMGLKIYLTEFDVNDTRLDPDADMRDELMASYTRDYLGMMLAYPEVEELLVWGMVDKYSWLQDFLPREDDVEKRPTPYDSNYRPKPMRNAIADAFKSAPARVGG